MWWIWVTLSLFHCFESIASSTVTLPVIHNATLQVAHSNFTIINGTCVVCLCAMLLNRTSLSALNCFRNNQTCQIFFHSWETNAFTLTAHLTTSVYLLALPSERTTMISAFSTTSTVDSTVASTTTSGIDSSMVSTMKITTTTTTPIPASVTVSSSPGPSYGWEQIIFSCLGTLTNLMLQITVQKTVGATYSGAYATLWGGTYSQAHIDNGAQIIYTWTIVTGQTIACSSAPYTFQAQFGLSVNPQITSTDTYILTETTSTGATTTLTGHF